METKFTRQYAAKLALQSEDVEDGATQLAFKAGYMKAIEETAAPELLEAAKFAIQICQGSMDPAATDCSLKLKEAIQKATQP